MNPRRKSHRTIPTLTRGQSLTIISSIKKLQVYFTSRTLVYTSSHKVEFNRSPYPKLTRCHFTKETTSVLYKSDLCFYRKFEFTKRLHKFSLQASYLFLQWHPIEFNLYKSHFTCILYKTCRFFTEWTPGVNLIQKLQAYLLAIKD